MSYIVCGALRKTGGMIYFAGNSVYLSNPQTNGSWWSATTPTGAAVIAGSVIPAGTENFKSLVIGSTKTLTFGTITVSVNRNNTNGFRVTTNNSSVIRPLAGSDSANKWHLTLSLDNANQRAILGFWTQADNVSDSNKSANYWSLMQNDTTAAEAFYQQIKGMIIKPDPYEQGGYSGEGGGEGGTFDFTGDTIGDPALPSLSPQASKLVSIYQVTASEMSDFADYLWSSGFQWSDIQKIFNSVMDAIIGLSVIPFTPTGGTISNIILGNVDTGVSSTLAGAQYVELDCGTITISEAYASCLDYNPYTKIDLILPYCGTVPLDPDEVMGKAVGVKYKIDLLTGACVACVFAGGSLLFTMSGNIAAPVPITANDFTSFYHAATGSAIGGAAAAAAVFGGISAPVALAGVAVSSAVNVANAKQSFHHGSAGNGNTALLGPQKPYIVMKRPAQCLPDNNNNYQGYPSYITAKLGDLHGFTKVWQIHLDDIPLTDVEKKELLEILKGGIII